MEKQRSEFDAGLPAARKFSYGPVEVIPLEFKLPSYFTAFPVWLVAVAHKKVECGLLWLKWIVLSEVSEAQSRVMNDFTAVELLFTQDYFEQGAFSGTISSYKPDLPVISNCC
jgi:hypothetical protein